MKSPIQPNEILKAIMKLPLAFLFLFQLVVSNAQEVSVTNTSEEGILSLDFNPFLFSKNKKQFGANQKNSSLWIYQTDTLSLPFLDDFSVNRIKRYLKNPSNPSVFEINKIQFSLNGNFVDSTTVLFDTTWYYIFNSGSQQYDSFPNLPGNVITFFGNNNPAFPSLLNQPTGSDTVWSNYTYRVNGTDTTEIYLQADSVFINSRDTFYFESDSSFYLWTDNGTYVNDGFSVNPPTIGAATFDGLDSSGFPYDFSLPATYGPADFLTSKPIDLGNLTTDSLVVLSFYFQPQGLGDFPDIEDSLALEFYSPSDSVWNWVWSTPGITSSQSAQQPVFQYVKFAVNDPKFLQKGFRFRFRNYATLSGMLDIWNVDYVYLDKNRNINDNAVNDLAFISTAYSFVNNFTSMPMGAFKGNAAQFMVQNYQEKISNLSNQTILNDSNRYFVFDETGTIEYKESINLQTNFAPLTQQVVSHSVFAAPNNFQFTPSSSNHTVFIIKNIIGHSLPDICNLNDTVIRQQIFDTYYSYDDGSAEGVYYLNSAGVQLAYKFSTTVPDSLKGIFFYFPYMKNDISQFTFKIIVWNDNNGVPGNIIYQSGILEKPIYSPDINDFVRYNLSFPVAVNGNYYIGWEQTTNDKIFIGLDKNINNQSKIFNTLTGSWNNTSVSGSLMMRPDFGIGEPAAGVFNHKTNSLQVNIFPNPAQDFINIRINNEEVFTTEKKFGIRITNVLGEEILFFKTSSCDFQVDVAPFQNGIYFIEIKSEKSGESIFHKLLKE